MADNHPYLPAVGPLTKVIAQLRLAVPPLINVDTLKKLGFAPKNEGSMVKLLRVLGFVDENSKPTKLAIEVFTIHDDATFAQAFGKQVSARYSDLFDLHGEAAWMLSTDQLIGFFRTSDKTTDLVASLQAKTFQVLAALSGHGVAATPGIASTKPPSKVSKPRKLGQPESATSAAAPGPAGALRELSRGVSININIQLTLPATTDEKVYEKLFGAMKTHLLS